MLTRQWEAFLLEGWEVYGNHSERQLVEFAIDAWDFKRIPAAFVIHLS